MAYDFRNDHPSPRKIATRARIVRTVDGDFMILVNGFQWGGDYDSSGAGNATFATVKDAIGAWTDTGHDADSIEVEEN